MSGVRQVRGADVFRPTDDERDEKSDLPEEMAFDFNNGWRTE